MKTFSRYFKNRPLAETSGSSLQGYINTDYKTLKKIFGEPAVIGKTGDKILVEWFIEFDDCIATIYNYKDGRNYEKDGLTKTQITNWHIGGFDKKSVDHVLTCIRVFNAITYNKK